MHRWSQYSLTNENIGIYEEIFENVDIVDSHTHIGKDRDGQTMSADLLMKKMKQSGVNTSIAFPLNEPGENNDFNQANDRILLASKVYKEKLIPFMRLNPGGAWKKEFKLRCDQGFRGVKLHPRSQGFRLTAPKVMEVYAACQDNNLPLLIHMGMGLEKIADDLVKMTKKFPKLKIFLGHAAFVDLDNVMRRCGKNENLLFETSSCRLFDLYELIKTVDYRRIAFGSDIPYYDIDWALQGVIDTAITLGKSANQIGKILGENSRKWFR